MKKIILIWLTYLFIYPNYVFSQFGRELDDGIRFAAMDLISNLANRTVKRIAFKEIANVKTKESGKFGEYALEIIKKEFQKSGLFILINDSGNSGDSKITPEAYVEGTYEELVNSVKLDLRMITVSGRIISLSSTEINKNEKTKSLLDNISDADSANRKDSVSLYDKKIFQNDKISIELTSAVIINDDVLFSFIFLSKEANVIIENYFDGAKIIDDEGYEYLPYSNLPRIIDLPANIKVKAEMKFRNIRLRNKTKIKSLEWYSSIGKIVFYNIELKNAK